MSNLQRKINHRSKWPYLAGFLDADGSIYVRIKPRKGYRYGFQVSPSVVFFQSSKERRKLEKIRDFCRLGYLRDRKDGITEWVVGDRKSIQVLIKRTLPYLVFKRKQAELMLDVLERHRKVKSKEDFLDLVEKIEQFKVLNYSKKRKNDRYLVRAKLEMELGIKLNNPLAP